MTKIRNTLKVRLLGQFEIKRGTEDLSQFPTRKSKRLFSFLALHYLKLHPRSVLAGVLWPAASEASARKRLRTELWMIRKFLNTHPFGGNLLAVAQGRVGLNPEADIWIDVEELETQLSRFEHPNTDRSPADCRGLEKAIALYRGELLEGSYEDWCIEARERLRVRILTAFEQLMHTYKRDQAWDAAIHCGQTLLLHEPLSESIHRDLMRCYFEKGDRAAALRQYERCANLLKGELDVEPMYETSTLYQKIKVHRGPVGLGLGPSTSRETIAATEEWYR